MRKPFQIYHFFCSVCGKPFIARRSHAKTCPKSSCRSVKSRDKAAKKQKPVKNIILEMASTSVSPSYLGMELKTATVAPKKNLEEPQHTREHRERAEARRAAEAMPKNITKPQFVICAMNGGLMIKDNCGVIVHIDNVLTQSQKCLTYGLQLRKKSREELPAILHKETAVEILLSNEDYIIGKVAHPQEGGNYYNAIVDVIKKEITQFSFQCYFKGF